MMDNNRLTQILSSAFAASMVHVDTQHVHGELEDEGYAISKQGVSVVYHSIIRVLQALHERGDIHWCHGDTLILQSAIARVYTIVSSPDVPRHDVQHTQQELFDVEGFIHQVFTQRSDDCKGEV